MTPRIVTAIILSLIVGVVIACSGSPASPAPVEPTLETAPVAPIAPVTPTAPTTPIAPVAPIAPIAPTEPPAPTEPSTPTEAVPPSTATVTGTVTYRERIALTPDAVVEIKLIDVSRMDAPSITIGEHIVDNPGQVPIAFEIEYDPANIDERFSYAVQARITEGGKLAFINDTRYSVITRGSPTNVDLVLIKVAAAPTEPPAPEGPNMVETPAPIESVKLTFSDSNPREYTLQIVSGLPGGCIEFDKYATSRENNTFNITVTNLAPAEPVPCTTIYGRHEGEVALGSEFTAGEAYTIIVNDTVTSSFTARDLEGPDAVVAESPIERVEVAVSESDPAEYTLQVISRLPKGSSCSWFNGYNVSRPFAGIIDLTVTHFEVTEMMPCTADLPVAATEIPLGSDFTPGEAYRVTVNGAVTNSFTAHDADGLDVVVAESPIERVEVAVSESDPAEYTLQVVSRLPMGSSCSWFNGYDISRPFAGVINVTVTHFEAAEMMPCTADLPAVETEIPLGSAFVAGETYTVNVNDELSETFIAQ